MGIQGEGRSMDERTRGAAEAAPPETGAAADELPSRNLPPATYQDLPEPLPLSTTAAVGTVGFSTIIEQGRRGIWWRRFVLG